MFDYNINDLTIDECRNCDDWSVKYSATKALAATKDKNVVNAYMYAIAEENQKDYWEFGFDDCYMDVDDKELWQESYKTIYGDAILTDEKSKERVKKKGYNTLTVRDSLFKVLSKAGIKSFKDVLSQNEAEGLTEVEVPPNFISQFNSIWSFLERSHLTNNKPQCEIGCFAGLVRESSTIMGFYQEGKIYLKNTLGGGELFKTIVEEIGHYITLSTDFSRDMQEFMLDVILAMNNDVGE
jgi:hypothetical protein